MIPKKIYLTDISLKGLPFDKTSERRNEYISVDHLKEWIKLHQLEDIVYADELETFIEEGQR